jgi:uncharacterized protein
MKRNRFAFVTATTLFCLTSAVASAAGPAALAKDPISKSSPVVFFEIFVKDGAKATEFYTKLFGWHASPSQIPDVTLVLTGPAGALEGAIVALGDKKDKPARAPTTVLYMNFDDIAAKLAEAVKLGATVTLPVTEIPGVGSVAKIADLDGNEVGLFQVPR